MTAEIIDLAVVRRAFRWKKPLTAAQRILERQRRYWNKLVGWIGRDRDFLSASERVWFDRAVGTFHPTDLPRLRRLNRLAYSRRFKPKAGEGAAA